MPLSSPSSVNLPLLAPTCALQRCVPISKIVSKHLPKAPKMLPRPLQNAPKSLPRRPKELPRSLQETPRSLQESQRDSQEASQSSQDAPKRVQEAPKRLQEAPKSRFWSLQAGYWSLQGSILEAQEMIFQLFKFPTLQVSEHPIRQASKPQSASAECAKRKQLIACLMFSEGVAGSLRWQVRIKQHTNVSEKTAFPRSF